MALPPWLRDRRGLQLLPWLCGLVAFAVAARSLIGSYADLGIYLDAAREWRTGGVDLCRDRVDSGPWVYPPWVAMPFAALQTVCGDTTIRWLWSASLGVATAVLVRATAASMRVFGGLRWWQWLAFAALFQRCIAQNLTHGQLSLWVGACIAAGLVALQRGRDGRAGALLGLAAALKVTPLLFVFALPLMRRPRAALTMLACVAFAILVLPWPFCGTAEHLRHLGDFARAALGSALDPQHAAIVREHAGPSIAGTLDYLLQARPTDKEGHLVAIVDLGDGALLAVKIGWAALLGTLLATWFWRARHLEPQQRLTEQAAVVLLAMVFFAPLVRVYHLAAAAVPFALFCRGPRQRRDALWWLCAIAILFATTLRQKKLLGETLWRTLDLGGLLHFALVALLVWNLRESRRPQSSD